MERNKNTLLIDEAIQLVKQKFNNESSGHDYLHMMRVYKNAVNIYKEEGGDLLVISLAALFHDFPDRKLTDNPEKEYDFLQKWMERKGLPTETISHVFAAMNSVSYKNGTNDCKPETIEAKIVQDADRLDAIGAIGIARTFTFGGSREQVLYDLENQEANTTLKHFDDKLLKLKNLMQTATGKAHAQDRDVFMREFLKQFYNEIG